jgi:hypothetical protein
MSSLQKSYANSKNFNYFINQSVLLSEFKYDKNGNSVGQTFIKGVDQQTNISRLSVSNLSISNTNLNATIICDTSNTSFPDTYWNVERGLWIVSGETYPANEPLTITFNSPNVTEQNDWRIALINATPQPPDGAGGFDIPGEYPGLYFWDEPEEPYTSSTVFTIEYDGDGTTTFKADGVVISTNTGQVFPNGIKLYMVFDDGVPDNRVFTVNLTIPIRNTIIIPANSLLCKNMGKTFIMNDETYLKVQNKKNVSDIFYFKLEDNIFVSLNI